MPNLWLIFTTGLLTGGVTCLAVQGGLLATCLAAGSKDDPVTPKSKLVPTLVFLTSKLVAYLILGALLGLVGASLQPSPFTRAIFQGLVAIYMLGVAGALLNVHPFFRYFIFSPPKFVTRWIRSQSKANQIFTPAILGAATIFIPCGTTQAMMALALTAANPLWSAAIMGAFVLGTWPLFLGLGLLITSTVSTLRTTVFKLASFVIIGMALWTLSGSLALLGRPINFSSVATNLYCTLTFCPSDKTAVKLTPVSHATIEILPAGYKTDAKVLKAGSQVTLTLKNLEALGCSQAFTIPALNLSEVVPPGTSKDVTITVPDKPGRLAFTCAMGMYSGEFSVVN